MQLLQELETFKSKHQELLAHKGMFVLIKGSSIIDLFETYEHALEEGYRKYGLEPFFVREIEDQHVLFVNRLDAKEFPRHNFFNQIRGY